uniref:Uncharacterized protein n=1 Tax=Heterorhabditis bacteriophora TaxID=37862 RepID=A0A1I7XBG1_HETBA
MDDVCKGSSDVARPLLEAFLREQCGRLFGLPQAAASLAELLHKEHSFRVKVRFDIFFLSSVQGSNRLDAKRLPSSVSFMTTARNA